MEEIIKKAIDDYEHRKNKRKNDPPLDTNSLRKFPPEFISKLVKARLTNDEFIKRIYFS